MTINMMASLLALPEDEFPELPISYNLAAQLYADLRALHGRLADAEERLRLQKGNNESLKFQLTQANLALQKMTTNYLGMREREKCWKKEKASLEKKLQTEKASLEKKLQTEKASLEKKLARIQNFHSYKLGQSIMEAEKKWGSALAAPIGCFNYRLKCQQERKKEEQRQAELKRREERIKLLQAASLREQDLVFPEPRGAKLKIAAIMDDFTRACYAPDCDLLDLDPQNWKRQLKKFAPDLVFIESAWQGFEERWQLKISGFQEVLQDLVIHCRKERIPTLFWNKEDPAHYLTFLPVARAVDYVFTTDIDRIPHYKMDVGHDRVYLLPFAAQPALHNPLEKYERKAGFCFAGSYYLRYVERQRDFANLVDAINSVSALDIYDRNFGKDHPHYKFPDIYSPYIKGNLPYAQIDRAYKGYKFGVNINTVKQSQSMFARRVYELAASNTLVLSNFSRGLRNFFGDLVISSDNKAELEKRVRPFLESPNLYRRQRLAALRRVMSLHTYADRLNYIRGRIWNGVQARKPGALLLSPCKDQEEALRAMASFERQSWAEKELFILGCERPRTVSEKPDVRWLKEPSQVWQAIEKSSASFIGVLDPAHFYGNNYLTDLVVASRYSAAPAFGKATRYIWRDEGLKLLDDGRQYRVDQALRLYACLVRKRKLKAFRAAFEAKGMFTGGMALDEFNFVEDGALVEQAKLEDALDLEIADTGVDFRGRTLPLAEHMRPATEQKCYLDETQTIDIDELAKTYTSRSKVKILRQGNKLIVHSTLPSDKFVYLHGNTYGRDELNLRLNSVVTVDAGGKLSIKFAFIFLDKNRKKISHSIINSGTHVLPIPPECEFVRISLRLEGSGSGMLRKLVFGNSGNRAELILCRGKTLIIAKQYPAYDDLYKYGFLHSRLRKYRENCKAFDMLRVRPAGTRFSEFENVDVATCDLEVLARTLESGQVETLAVHILDRQCWEVLKRYVERIHILIWVHGAEIQNWKRREFECALLKEEEIEYLKRRSAHFVALWREVFEYAANELVKLIFVSDTLRQEAEEDIGLPVPTGKFHVIHNFIDGDLFKFQDKTADFRFNIISIRPYSALTYANDLSVAAILELSGRPGFSRYNFTIIGDGPLFEGTVAPLRDFDNVKIERNFLTQTAMVERYKSHGIMLVPTRSDTQGVSRDEAMACGLVAVTSNVAAVPEFVDETCAFLAPAEDYMGLANAIEKLASDEKLFSKMSRKAADRVRKQSGFEQTIAREIKLVFD